MGGSGTTSLQREKTTSQMGSQARMRMMAGDRPTARVTETVLLEKKPLEPRGPCEKCVAGNHDMSI